MLVTEDGLILAGHYWKKVFMSGYTSDAVARHGIQELGEAFLQKPFKLGTLAQTVRDALAK